MSSRAVLLSPDLIDSVTNQQSVELSREVPQDKSVDDVFLRMVDIIQDTKLSSADINLKLIESLKALPFTYYFEVLQKLSAWIQTQEFELSLNDSDSGVLVRSELIQNVKNLIVIAKVSQAKAVELDELSQAFSGLIAMQNSPKLNPKIKEFLVMLSLALLVLLGIVGYAAYRNEQEREEYERERAKGLSVENIQDELDIFTIEL
jgi:predicted XRE-type DNA-binding protein